MRVAAAGGGGGRDGAGISGRLTLGIRGMESV